MDKCRICLKSSKKIKSLFDKEDDVVYIDMIKTISNMKIRRDDKLTNLCYKCCRKLKEAFDFKNMIEMANMILCEDTNLKRIHFNTLDELKYKAKIDMMEEICKNSSTTEVLETVFNGDTRNFCFNNTIIKRVDSRGNGDESEIKPLNIYDYVTNFKIEASDDDFDHNRGYDSSGVSDTDDDYELPLKQRKKVKVARKGKENRNDKNINSGTKRKKYLNETLRVKIKPVYLEDLRIVRTKRKKKIQTNKTTGTKQMCNFCGKMTTSIKTHMLIHTGEKTYKCNICERAYYTEPHLKAHKKKHEFHKKYECNQCIAKFSQLDILKRHMAVHNEEKKYVCHICNKSFKRSSNLNRHIIFHNSANKNIKCEKCNMTFFTNSALNHHLRVHTGERPYRCEICSQGYSYKHDFNRHCFKKHAVFIKRRSVFVMNEEVLVKERELMRVLMLRLQGVAQGDDPFKEFEGPQGYKALEQAITLLESKQLPVDVHF